jgi:GH25 family lysozyme M1 (1,4-beta-N-acetylmuramidase)
LRACVTNAIIGCMDILTDIARKQATRRDTIRLAAMIAATGAVMAFSGSQDVALADDSIVGDSPVIWRHNGSGWASNVGTFISDTDASFGVDSSEHDGTVDWQSLVENGISFAILRCGFGVDRTKYDDDAFLSNVRGCEDAGIPYGIYLYSYAMETDDAKSEAHHVVRQAGRCVPSLGIWYDIEEPRQGRAIGWSPSKFAEFVTTFRSTVKREYGSDVPIGVYASQAYVKRYLTDESIADVPLWMARWAGRPNTAISHNLWQAGSCRVSGARHPMDFDVHFNGNKDGKTVRTTDVFGIGTDIASMRKQLAATQDTLRLARRQLAASVAKDYKDGKSGQEIAALLDASSISELIRRANATSSVTDSVVDMRGRIMDLETSIDKLKAKIAAS